MEQIKGGVRKIMENITRRIQENRIMNLSKVDKLLFLLVVFSISRIRFYEVFSVFALGMYVAGIKTKTNDLLFKISLILALITSGNIRVLAILLCFMTFTFIFERGKKKENVTKREKVLLGNGISKNSNIDMSKINIKKLALIFGVIYIALSIVIEKIENTYSLISPSTYIIFILNAALILILSELFAKTIKVLYIDRKYNLKINEEFFIALSLIVILGLIGIRDVFIFRVSIEEVIIFFLLESICFISNALVSTFAATLLSVPIMIEGKIGFVGGAISLIGMIMGNVKTKEKLIYALIYSSSMVMIYIIMADKINLSITFIWSLMLSETLFLTIPSKYYQKAAFTLEELFKTKRKDYYKNIKGSVIEELKEEKAKYNDFLIAYQNVIKTNETDIKNKLIANELMEVSKSFDSVINRLKNAKIYRTNIEEELKEVLEKIKVEPVMIKVREDLPNEYDKRIRIDMIISIEDKSKIVKIIRKIKQYFSKDFTFDISSYNSCEENIKLEIYEEDKIKTRYGLFEAAKDSNGISGDNYSIYKYKNKILVAIADGMGKGKMARLEAEKALVLLKSMIGLECDDYFMINFINQAMYDEQKETYSTLDAIVIDTKEGTCKFLKSGAISTYIKRDKELVELESSSMPIGIVSEISIYKKEYALKKGDKLYIMSDGTIDNISTRVDKKEVLEGMLKAINKTSIQSEVNTIGLEIAKSANLKDDMTIIGVEIY